MPELPSGSVTFLFTDIEGSTRLLHELGAEDYAHSLAEHRRVLREAFDAHGGVEVDTQGDAFFVAFPSAPGALRAAAEAQAGLAPGPILVRMGIHTGTPHLTNEGYVGVDVHRAARIGGCGHGGQTLVSATTVAALGTDGLHDLGEHRLKDFDQPISIFQVGDEAFPPLKTISNTNLPRPASSFVGREREVEEVRGRLQDGVRLLTLTGPGGSGKTRLAIEAATELVPDFKAGVFWVGLAAVRDSALVPVTIAQTLGAKDGLTQHIGERELLLLLDNLEQVVESAPELASLVESCANLRLLVTSRELLRVRGEVEYPVLPLAGPDAVELFCTRAQAEPDEAVHELCAALDNLPLALELAAARTTILSPTQILERLSQRLDLLKGGRDADPRQQTLRAAIEWSHDLLGAEEQRLFARLAVFSGGCTLEAAQNVVDADLDTLQSLVDKSLVRHNQERFGMLETIREYAVERLKASGEAEELRQRHAQHFLKLAKEAEDGLRGADEASWLIALEDEHNNLRAVLLRDDGDLQLDLAAALMRFWSVRGHLEEGSRWLREALEREPSDPGLRAKALHGAATIALYRGDLASMRECAGEALELFEGIGDKAGVARALLDVAGVAVLEGEYGEAQALFERCRTVALEAGDRRYLAGAIINLGDLALQRGDWEQALALSSEGLALGREQESLEQIATALANVAFASFRLGDHRAAATNCSECLELVRQLRAETFIANWLVLPAALAVARGALEQGFRLLAMLGALIEAGAGPPFGAEQELREETSALLRDRLEPDMIEDAEAAAESAAFDEAVTYALESLSATPNPPLS